MTEEDPNRVVEARGDPGEDDVLDDDTTNVEAEETPGVGRLLALSDGVVAIALTLLVLQLVVPEMPMAHGSHNPATSPEWLWHKLTTSGGDQFTAYIVSFYVIGQFWLTHHREFRNIVGHDEGLAWWNFVFLFAITLMPFTSDLLGRFGQNPLAITIFALNLLFASLSTVGLRVFARHKGLLKTVPSPEETQLTRFRTLGVIAIIGTSMALAWVRTDLAMFSWLLLLGVQRWSEWMVRRFPPKAVPVSSV